MITYTKGVSARSWTRGQIAMAIVMGLAWLLVWYSLLDVFGRAHRLEFHYGILDIVVPRATLAAIWIGEWANDLWLPLSLAFLAGLAVMLWRMRGRVWVGYAVGTLITLVLLVAYVLVMLRPLTPKVPGLLKRDPPPCVRNP
jgi:hypothetical protein